MTGTSHQELILEKAVTKPTKGLSIRSAGGRRPDRMPPVVEWGPQKNREDGFAWSDFDKAGIDPREPDDN